MEVERSDPLITSKAYGSRKAGRVCVARFPEPSPTDTIRLEARCQGRLELFNGTWLYGNIKG